jgi:hypothetical protein
MFTFESIVFKDYGGLLFFSLCVKSHILESVCDDVMCDIKISL